MNRYIYHIVEVVIALSWVRALGNNCCPSSFDEFWRELLSLVKPCMFVQTICEKSSNHIVSVDENYIIVESVSENKSKRPGNKRKLYKWYFEQVFNKVTKQKRVFLKDFPKLRRRLVSSIVFAVMAQHPCMRGECVDGKVVLKACNC